MRIMGLDQSGFCGFCHGVAGAVPAPPAGSNVGPPVYGTHRLPKNLPMSGRLVHFEDWLRDMISANEIEKVYFEEPIAMQNAGSFASRVALYGYAAAIGMACHREGVQCVAIAMQTWRSEFGVPTQAPKRVLKDKRREWVKKATMDRCRSLGFDPQDDNAGDAIGIWSAMSARILLKAATPQFDFTDNITI